MSQPRSQVCVFHVSFSNVKNPGITPRFLAFPLALLSCVMLWGQVELPSRTHCDEWHLLPSQACPEPPPSRWLLCASQARLWLSFRRVAAAARPHSAWKCSAWLLPRASLCLPPAGWAQALPCAQVAVLRTVQTTGEGLHSRPLSEPEVTYSCT